MRRVILSVFCFCASLMLSASIVQGQPAPDNLLPILKTDQEKAGNKLQATQIVQKGAIKKAKDLQDAIDNDKVVKAEVAKKLKAIADAKKAAAKSDKNAIKKANDDVLKAKKEKADRDDDVLKAAKLLTDADANLKKNPGEETVEKFVTAKQLVKDANTNAVKAAKLQQMKADALKALETKILDSGKVAAKQIEVLEATLTKSRIAATNAEVDLPAALKAVETANGLVASAQVAFDRADGFFRDAQKVREHDKRPATKETIKVIEKTGLTAAEVAEIAQKTIDANLANPKSGLGKLKVSTEEALRELEAIKRSLQKQTANETKASDLQAQLTPSEWIRCDSCKNSAEISHEGWTYYHRGGGLFQRISKNK